MASALSSLSKRLFAFPEDELNKNLLSSLPVHGLEILEFLSNTPKESAYEHVIIEGLRLNKSRAKFELQEMVNYGVLINAFVRPGIDSVYKMTDEGRALLVEAEKMNITKTKNRS